MESMNFYLHEKMIQESIRSAATSYYRPSYLVAQTRSRVQQAEAWVRNQCRRVQLRVAGVGTVRVELCGCS